MARVGLSNERKRGLFNVVFVTSEYLDLDLEVLQCCAALIPSQALQSLCTLC